MAHTDPHGGHAGGPIGHETTDANLTSVETVLFVLAVSLAVVFAIVWLVYGQLKAREAGLDTPPPAIAKRTGDRLPPLPRLQTTPYGDLQQFRQAEDRILNGYAWVDQAGGVVQVPVRRAIELMAEKGMPPRPAAPPAP
jgi:hypothetical protein